MTFKAIHLRNLNAAANLAKPDWDALESDSAGILNKPPFDLYVGELDPASDSLPAANDGHYFIAADSGDIDGLNVFKGLSYRCNADGSVAGDSSAWARSEQHDHINDGIYDSVAALLVDAPSLDPAGNYETLSYYGGWALNVSTKIGGARYTIVEAADAASRPDEDLGGVIHVGSTNRYLSLVLNEEVWAEQFGARALAGFDNQTSIQNALNYISWTPVMELKIGAGRYEIGDVSATSQSSAIYFYQDATDNPGMNPDRNGLLTLKGAGKLDFRALRFLLTDNYGTVFIGASNDCIFKIAKDGLSPYPIREVVLSNFSIINMGVGVAVDSESCPGFEMEHISIAVATPNGSAIKNRTTWNSVLRDVKCVVISSVTQVAPTTDTESVGILIGNTLGGGGRNAMYDCTFDGFWNNLRDLSTDQLTLSTTYVGCAFQNSVDTSIDINSSLSLSLVSAHFEGNAGRDIHMKLQTAKLSMTGQNFFLGGTDTVSGKDLPCIELEGVLDYSIDGIYHYRPWQPLLRLAAIGGVRMKGSLKNVRWGVPSTLNANVSGPVYLVDPGSTRDMPYLENVSLPDSATNYAVYDESQYDGNEVIGSVVKASQYSIGEMHTYSRGAATVFWNALPASFGFPNFSPRITGIALSNHIFSLPASSVVVDGQTLELTNSDTSDGYISIQQGTNVYYRLYPGNTVRITADHAGGDWSCLPIGEKLKRVESKADAFEVYWDVSFQVDLSAKPATSNTTLVHNTDAVQKIGDVTRVYDSTGSLSATRRMTIPVPLLRGVASQTILLDQAGQGVSLEWIDDQYGYEPTYFGV